MKKFFCILLLIGTIFIFTGCDIPDSLQMDVYKGASAELKLLHVNASSPEKREQIEGITNAIINAAPIEKDISLFAFYPDYTIEVDSPSESGTRLRAIVDINGEYVDFYYPGPYPEQDGVIYRSEMTAEEFNALIHQK